MPVQAAPLSIKQKAHLAVIGTLVASECIELSQQESKTKGAKVNRLLRDLVRILNQYLMIYGHTETSFSAHIPFTYNAWNAWTHLTELFTESPETDLLDEEITTLNSTKNNTELNDADAATIARIARLKKLSKLFFPTIEIIASCIIALIDHNSPEAQEDRLMCHALVSLSRTLAEWIESDSGSPKAKAMTVLLLTNFVTIFLDMKTVIKIGHEEYLRQRAELQQQWAQANRRREQARRAAEEHYRQYHRQYINEQYIVLDDPYVRLGVERNASIADINRRFRELSRDTHPDHGGNQAEYQRIVAARELLINENQRRTYDNQHR